MKFYQLVTVSTLTLFMAACGGGSGSSDSSTTPSTTTPTTPSTSTPSTTTPTTPSSGAPTFKIVTHSDAGFTATNRKIVVFGIPVYAYADVEDTKLTHAANIMAQYLDNNEDGVVDNPTLLAAMKANKAALYLWKTEAQQGTINAQDLGADETVPAWHTNGQRGRFDAALEEVWHVVTHSGYAKAYPTIFGETAGTSLTNAMDIARGGNFTTIPNPYPANAWYTYNDQTCNYECMAAEYIYWSMSSILGAQKNRLSEIQQEWKLNTRALVETTDTEVFSLLTDAQYAFPTVLPDGTYRSNSNSTAVDPAVSQFGIFKVLNSGTTVEMKGEISSNSLTNFNNLLANYPDIKRIEIISSEGSFDDETNLQLSKLVHDRRINIHLRDNGLIASGAVDFFLAGIKRTIGTNTKIGVHSWSDGTNQASDYPRGHANHLPYIEYYKSVGFTQKQAEDFYYFTINAASTHDIHYMTPDEIQRYGLLSTQ